MLHSIQFEGDLQTSPYQQEIIYKTSSYWHFSNFCINYCQKQIGIIKLINRIQLKKLPMTFSYGQSIIIYDAIKMQWSIVLDFWQDYRFLSLSFYQSYNCCVNKSINLLVLLSLLQIKHKTVLYELKKLKQSFINKNKYVLLWSTKLYVIRNQMHSKQSLILNMRYILKTCNQALFRLQQDMPICFNKHNQAEHQLKNILRARHSLKISALLKFIAFVTKFQLIICEPSINDFFQSSQKYAKKSIPCNKTSGFILIPSFQAKIKQIYLLLRINKNNMYESQSFLYQRSQYLSPSLKVFILGDNGNSFGGEDGNGANISHKIGGGDSKEKAKFLKIQNIYFFQLLIDVRDLFDEIVRGVVAKNALLVHVLPASLKIDQSNYVIENRFNRGFVLKILLQQHNTLLNYGFRLIMTIKEGVELINDV